MNGDIGAWLLKGVISVVVVSLGIAVRGLFARLRDAEARLAVIEAIPAPCDAAGRAAQAELAEFRGEAQRELQDLRLSVAEHYIRRDDYVAQMGLVTSKLDAIGVMVARMDERMKSREGHHDA